MEVLSVQETRTGGLAVTTEVTVELAAIDVEGNHGGAKFPWAKRRSKKTFRVIELMFWMVFWIRPPTIFSVLIWFPVLTMAPLPPLLTVATEASISRFIPALGIWRLTFPPAVNKPKTCVLLLLPRGINVSAGVDPCCVSVTGSVLYVTLPVTSMLLAATTVMAELS